MAFGCRCIHRDHAPPGRTGLLRLYTGKAVLTSERSWSCGVAMVAMALAQPSMAQEAGRRPACDVEVVRGRVSGGEPFEALLPGALLFRLDPDTTPRNPPGWTLRVSPRAARDHDYSMVATPPYRFWNPRYLDTSYGVSATEALARTPREFSFVASEGDYGAAKQALDVLLWSGTRPKEEVDGAADELSSLAMYSGTFWVEDGATTPPDSIHQGGTIAWVSFRVRLCVPEDASR